MQNKNLKMIQLVIYGLALSAIIGIISSVFLILLNSFIDFLWFDLANTIKTPAIYTVLLCILGGPIGILLGWIGGSTIGATRDAKEIQTAKSVFEQTFHSISEGKTGIILIADALSLNDLRRHAEDKLGGRLLQLDYELVMNEIEHARETERELEKEAKKRWFEKKK